MDPTGGSEALEPYRIYPLLHPALPRHPELKRTSPNAVGLAVRCAEGNGRNLYVGSSNGLVHHYVREDQGSSTHPDQFRLVSSRVISTSGKPIERLLILSRVGLAVVVAESTLSFLHLPNLDPLPPRVLPVIRGVSAVVLDDDELQQGGTDGEGFVSLCVIRRKQAVLAKVGMGQWIPIKEVALPPGVVMARRCADSLCTASTTDYNLVNLSTSQVIPLGLPISQSTESPSASTRPSIVSLPTAGRRGLPAEFLVTSHSDHQTLGVFVQTSGEPSPKLIEWDSHPRGVFVDGDLLVALLRDDTVQVHDLTSMQRIQTIQLPSSLEPRLLSLGASQLEVTSGCSAQIRARLQSPMALGPADMDTPSSHQELFEARTDALWRTAIEGSSPRTATILMTCKDAVQGLVEPRPLSDATSLISQGRWAALQNLMHKCWATEESLKVANPDRPATHESVVIAAIYSLLSLQQLQALDFYSATTSILRSSLDVRAVLRLFPEVYEIPQEPVSILAPQPLHAALGKWRPITEMVGGNLQWLYAPHLTLADTPELQVLRQQLLDRAYDMLEAVLEDRRGGSEVTADKLVAESVDTALARVYARKGNKTKFAAFLSSSTNAVNVERIRAAAHQVGAVAALAELHHKRGHWQQTVDLWVQLIDGDIEDDLFQRNVDDVVQLLLQCDADTQARHAFWTVRHDPSAGVKLLASAHKASNVEDGAGGLVLGPEQSLSDPHAIVETLRKQGDTGAAEHFLEQLVLGEKRQNAALHEELLQVLFQRVVGDLDSEDMYRFYKQATDEYRKGGYAEPFVGHLALSAASAPKISGVTDRLKLIMLLQGSRVYDVERFLQRIEGRELMAYEHAILLGKLGHHSQALRMLAITLRDASSAEAYCCQGGNVLSPWVAEQIISWTSALDLRPYAVLLSRGVKSAEHTKSALKDSLLRSLLQVYMGSDLEGANGHARMSDGELPDQTLNVAATAHLLNTQALHMSALDILPLVPETWPLSTLQTFLSRNLRRESHLRHERSIQRATALGHSLERTEEAWSALRALGGVIQDEGDLGGDNLPESADTTAAQPVLMGEKGELVAEKVVGGIPPPVSVVSVDERADREKTVVGRTGNDGPRVSV
ncbi:unnamed protein product [Parajaminaea phylloscopi]